MRIGLVGCGAISANYLKNGRNYPNLEFVACADLESERATARAEEFSIPRACSVEELIADPGIEAVLNLTIPDGHYPLAMQAVERGKHVYNEKPLAVTREEGRRLVETARARGVLVGCAPDTPSRMSST